MRILGLVLIAAVAAAQTQGIIHVGPNVQVSKDLGKEPNFEMQIAADPVHPERMLACSMLFPADYAQTEVVTYATLDGGKSWKPTLRTRGEAGNASWDPTCAYGPDGAAYTISENIDADNKSFDRIDRSTDGGMTWEKPVRFKHAERNFVTIDTTGGPHNGWIYLQGAGRQCVTGAHCINPYATYFQYSADGGQTFLSQVVAVADSDYPIGYGPGVVLSDGAFLAPRGEWRDVRQLDGPQMRVPSNELSHDGRWANAKLNVFRAKVDKPNWPLDVELNTVGDWFYERNWNNSFLPMMAADSSKGPFRDRVYVVWSDRGSGRDVILLAYSSDQGKTWSTPRIMDDDRARSDGRPGPDDLQAVVAVNPQGAVGVMWFDRRDHPDDLGWTVRFRASFDGGETFTPSVRVSEIPYELDRTDPIPLLSLGGGATPNAHVTLGVHSFNFSGGHTAGLAASADGVFHPLWVGNSTGVPQLWTAAVTVEGTPEKNGSAALAEMKDVSGKVSLRFTNRTLERSTRMVNADLQIENLSEDTFHAPLKLRVLDMSSDLGLPEIENADSGGKGEGAIFDLSSLLDNGELKPHAATKPKHIQVKMLELDPIRPLGSVAVFSVAKFGSKLLAQDVTGPTKDSPALKPK